MTDPHKIKTVVIGDGTVGKTCLLITYTQDKFPDEYVPTVFDNYETLLEMNDEYFQVSLWDTAGQEEFDNLRVLSYPETDMFLICFSIVNHDSFENVEHRWIPELNEKNRDTPRMLIGTKTDLRNDEGTLKELQDLGMPPPITFEQGQKFAMNEKNNICAYLECSALERYNLKEVFVRVCEEVMGKRLGSMKIDVRANEQAKGKVHCCHIL